MESVYDRLARMHREEQLDFSHARTFNLDEYVGLPASDPHSYRHYMQEHLFRHVDVDLRNTHLPHGDAPDLAGVVALKERYKLIICVRETPLSTLSLEQLAKLSRFVEARRRLVACYDEWLAPLIPRVRPLKRDPRSLTAWHIYPVRIDFRAARTTRPRWTASSDPRRPSPRSALREAR